MKKINSIEELQKLQGELKTNSTATSLDSNVKIKVAMATCGIASGAKVVMDYFIEELGKRNIDAHVTQTGCMGYCYAEPTVEVCMPNQNPLVFGYVDTKKANEIIERYIKNNELIDGIIPINYETIEK
ncbi:MAG: (2Fe-2S) ferredoxin domain-containing protein [Bacteroidota bacterium]